MDVVASKTLSWFFDPYVGLGIQFASGDLDVPVGGATGLPVAISGHQSFAVNDLVVFRIEDYGFT